MPRSTKADAIREALEALAYRNNGNLTPELVVDEARSNKDSPLHFYREFHGWNVDASAEARWLGVGKELVRRYITVVVRESNVICVRP